MNRLAIGALALSVAVTMALVPAASWREAGQPTTHAIYGFLLAVALLAILRRRGRQRQERLLVAIILGAMPMVYVLSGLREGAVPAAEYAGMVLFGSLAFLGWFVSPWFLVFGILAHGLGWDAWHVHSRVVPGWYAIACATVDVGLGIYAASRVRDWILMAPREEG